MYYIRSVVILYFIGVRMYYVYTVYIIHCSSSSHTASVCPLDSALRLRVPRSATHLCNDMEGVLWYVEYATLARNIVIVRVLAAAVGSAK